MSGIGGVGLELLESRFLWTAIFWLAVAGYAIGYGVYKILLSSYRIKIKPEKHSGQFQEVLNKKEEGWELGHRLVRTRF